MLSARALERRLKRHLMKDRQVCFAPCVPGFEDVLAAEVAELPLAEAIEPVTGGVSFAGPLDLVYHANLRLATAHRVLLRIGDYLAQSFPMLYDHLRRIHWELYLGFQPRYSVRVTASESKLNLQSRIAETLADAIQARCGELGLQPKPTDGAPIEIHLRLYRDRCKVSLNTSGEHLHKRGMRKYVGEAPLRETVAAGCLLAADVSAAQIVVDPFCGSGAMVVEAARILAGYPPGAARGFAFEQMAFFQRSKWERFRAEAIAEARAPARARVVASDLDGRALQALRVNLQSASTQIVGLQNASPENANLQNATLENATLGNAILGNLVEIAEADALTREYPPAAAGGRALVAANLPYGRRVLSPRDADLLARRFASVLAERATGFEVALVTQHPQYFSETPFEVLRRTDFRNGGLRVTFLRAAIRSASPGRSTP